MIQGAVGFLIGLPMGAVLLATARGRASREARRQADGWAVRSPGTTASGRVPIRKSTEARITRARIHTRG